LHQKEGATRPKIKKLDLDFEKLQIYVKEGFNESQGNLVSIDKHMRTC
jgi:small nuclear ribonucleoprotein (snRNP)-like protein